LRPDRPRYIQFYPTLRCNLSCASCFNRGIPDSADIAVNDFERIATVLADNDIREIDILGGEPTLYADIVTILDINVERSIMTSLNTNGSNIPLLKRIASRFLKEKVQLGVSLYEDTFSTELNDFILDYKPVVKSITTKFKYINNVAKRYLDTDGLYHYLIYMDVLNKEDLASSLPFYEYYRLLNAMKEKHKNVNGVYCSGFIADIEDSPEVANVRCPAGTTKLSVMPDGTVYPCYLLARDQRYVIGNLLEDSFSDMWNNPILDHFRSFSGNTCENELCYLFPRCRGGCPAVSLMVHGNLMAPDPRCATSN
jgi:radical SAM protein with 4Fe4S-binding SPASM domain